MANGTLFHCQINSKNGRGRAEESRILEWVAMPSFRGSSQPMNQTRLSCVSCIGRQVLYTLAPPEKNILLNRGDFILYYFFPLLVFFLFLFLFILWTYIFSLVLLTFCPDIYFFLNIYILSICISVFNIFTLTLRRIT